MSATDWDQAEEDGQVTPKAGVDEAYDTAVQLQKDAERALEVLFALMGTLVLLFA